MDPNAENYINHQDVEMSWAIKTMKQAEVHFNLLKAFKDCSKIRLTNIDDQLFSLFNEAFPDLKVEVITDDELKNPEAKIKWRDFCNKFEHTVNDFNFATLLRLDCKKPYSEDNTTIVPRVQFLAIEIARNRNNLNNFHS